MRRGKKLFVSIFIVFILGVVSNFLLQNSYYSKQTVGEIIWRTFSYSAENQVASIRNIFVREKVFALEVPFFKQGYPVTCEVASLRMVLNYYGLSVSEDELLTHLRFDTTDPITPEGIWGDPDKGFVGSVHGSIFERTGYGVHDAPIRNLARVYRNAVEVQNPDMVKIIGLLKGGKPVITWGLLSSRNPVSWRTEEGKKVVVYPGEHVRVVIGYTGTAEDPDKLILLDPIYGKIRMPVEEFTLDWKMMNNRAVVVL